MEIAVKSCKNIEILFVCQRIGRSPPSFQIKPIPPVILSLFGLGILLSLEIFL
jgi:hypothetical protein